MTPGEAATIEMPVDGAALAFEWKFAGPAEGPTRLTQRVVLKGQEADTYLEQAKMYGANLPDGMKKIAAAMTSAAARQATGKR